MAVDPKRQSADEIVAHTVKCFITDAVGMEPTDGAKAIADYFEKNARDELKARVKAEGKTAKGCWRFIEAVARKANAQHIDPVAVYAIAMHYFEDVPAMPEWEPGIKAEKGKEDGGARAAAPTPAKTATPTPAKPTTPTPAKPATPIKAKKPAKKANPKKVRMKWVQQDIFGMYEQQIPAGEDIGAIADAHTDGANVNA